MRRTRGPRKRLGAVVLALLAASCGSVPKDEWSDDSWTSPPTARPVRVAAPEPRKTYVAISEIAVSLGLSPEPAEAGERLDLVASDGTRVLVFPGTTVVSVAGTRVNLKEPVSEGKDEYWVTAPDAQAIRTAWMARPATSEPKAVAHLGPPPLVDGPRPRETARAPGALEPSQAERIVWSVRPRLRDWRYIVIHHSASPVGSAAEIDRWHRAPPRNWDGLGYHFVIGNGSSTPDGSVEVGFRWRQQREGAHARTDGNFMNEHGIGICLVGDFNDTAPTSAQMRSLERLCRFLTEYCHLSQRSLRVHSDVKTTDCPGRKFPMAFLATMSASGRVAGDAPRGSATAGSR